MINYHYFFKFSRSS